MPVWMNAADVMIMSSRAEGSPNVVKEAMACDLPIVAAEVGDVAEVIGGTRHCHLHHWDPAAAEMGESIVEVVRAIPERSNGRDRTEHLGLEAVALRLREVYDRALERGPGPLGFLHRRS
jgi:teichuronic acid biosynthesis glycosyltransferase TuaC